MRLLGAQSVRQDGVELSAVSAQPKRLGLLTYLILAPSRGDGFVSRDTLHAFFWPESDQEHARNSLNQYVFQLRSGLGSDAIVSHGHDRLGINRELVRVDALEFRSLVAGNELESALELYTGELLPGLYVPGADVEWEQWLDGQRRRFKSEARDAALALGRQASGNDWPSATRWYRRAVEIDPESASAAEAVREAERQLWAPDGSAGEGPESPKPVKEPAEPVAGSISWSSWSVYLVVMLLAVVGWLAFGRAGDPPGGPPEPAKRLAIIPLANLTGDTTQNYLIDGLHSSLIAETGRLDAVQVISRTSIVAASDNATIAAIAARLEVDLVLEGAVRWLGDSVEAQFRLVDSQSENDLWSESYRTKRTNWLQLVERLPRVVSREVATIADPQLRVPSGDLRPLDPAAIEAFFRGEWYGRQWGKDSIQLAYYDEALRIEPGFARAHVARGRILYIQGGWFGRHSPVEKLPAARNAMDKALSLDPDLAEAHLGLANLLFTFYWDWAQAEREYVRAIELNPSHALARNHYGNFLRAMRRVEEGVLQLERATELDPLHAGHWAELAGHYTQLGRFEEAKAASARSAELAPESVVAKFTSAFRLFEQGRAFGAAEMMERSGMLAFSARMYALAGEEAKARQLLESLSGRERFNSLSIAGSYAVLGDTSAALEWLERGYRERDPNLVWLFSAVRGAEQGDHPMAPGWPPFGMANHPRVQELLARMNFPEPPVRLSQR